MKSLVAGVSLAALVLAACSNPSKTASVDGGALALAAAPSQAQATRLLNGKPYWSSTKTYSADQNAQRVFASNGAEFAASNVDAYVRLTHAFVEKPPAGAQTLTRANGDRLIYDAAGNVFAVVSKDGAPRTMFKPSTGAAYWSQQVASGGEFTSKTTASATSAAKTS